MNRREFFRRLAPAATAALGLGGCGGGRKIDVVAGEQSGAPVRGTLGRGSGKTGKIDVRVEVSVDDAALRDVLRRVERANRLDSREIDRLGASLSRLAKLNARGAT